MPELPEVETIKLGLQKKIIGLKFNSIQILSPKSFIGDANKIKNKEILGLKRMAKILRIDLNNNLALLIHLKMSGQLILEGKKRFIGGHPTQDMQGDLPNRSTRVVFSLSDGSKLYFNDQRRFGWIKLLKTDEIRDQKLIKSLGPEPLEDSFTWEVLKNNLLKHKTMPVKSAIMDQSTVSGIGNIYASEACFDAKLNPKTKISELTDAQFKTLHKGIIKCLLDGIKYGGSSKTHFVNEEGKKGYFLDYANVYWKDGADCRVCGTEIEKIQLNGRGTYFCPVCQK